jgi:hypothetical protein
VNAIVSNPIERKAEDELAPDLVLKKNSGFLMLREHFIKKLLLPPKISPQVKTGYSRGVKPILARPCLITLELNV